MAEQVVELAPGESKLVSFEAIPTVAKSYQVSVNGLVGSFVAVKAQVEITSISISKRNLMEEDPFTISITFSNPHDYDVWVRPVFGFGKITNGFAPEPVLAGLGWDGYLHMDTRQKMEWLDLGIVAFMGSGMTNYIYDPEGIPMVTGEYAYLKVPAKGSRTTSKLWYTSYYARSRRYSVGAGWMRYWITEVYPPIDLDVCVKVESAFYALYDPECGVFQGKTVNYRRVSYKPLPIVGMVPNVVNVRSTKTPYP